MLQSCLYNNPSIVDIDLGSPWYLEYEKLPLQKTKPRDVLYQSPTTSFVYKYPISHSRIFQSYGNITITGERLQILTYVRHLWLLSSQGFSACHTYCGMGHPFIMVISKDQWHSHLLPSVWQRSCHYLFLRLRWFFSFLGSGLDL